MGPQVSMNALVWNCRGVGSPLTFSQLEETVKLHSPSIIFLSETKNNKTYMNRIKMKLKYDSLFVVDPVGKSGGLVAYSKNEVKVCKVLFT